MTPQTTVLPGSLLEIVPRRLLIVEDHESTAQVMQKLLQRHGHEVWLALTYREALEVAKNQSVEVLICDLKLPDGDGCALFQEMRAAAPLHGIVMSGHSAPADFERTLGAGFAAHLVKPFDITEIEMQLVKMFS